MICVELCGVQYLQYLCSLNVLFNLLHVLRVNVKKECSLNFSNYLKGVFRNAEHLLAAF